MKKVATVTLDGYFNYGNILQRYALCRVLIDMGLKVDSLWCNNDVKLFDKLLSEYPWMQKIWNWKTYIKLSINWRNITTNMIGGKNAWEAARCAFIKCFCDRYIPIRYDIEFADIADDYDYLVTGSDQVWNVPSNWEETFLKFAPSEKRIAYAASISCPEIPQDKQQTFIDGVNGMKEISVREQAGADLIQQLTGRRVQVVADPTMLVTAEDWRSIARKPSWLKGDEQLLVTYFLGKRPDSVIESIARENGLQIVNMLDERVFEHYAIAPEEWLWLIDHARFMYTDSFHGTVFSILFRTPFVVTERVDAGCAKKMTSRIDTLLAKFDLSDRRGTNANSYMIASPLDMHYGDVDKVLAEEKQRAEAYLCHALI